jgi:dTDP-4-amino-4,6-dideoxygalactose transaminase
MHQIPVLRPRLPKLEVVIPLLQEIDASRIYSNNGPMVERYKFEISKFLGVSASQIVILSSATKALQGLLELSSCNRWLVPDFTFTASGLAVIASGKQLVLLDIDVEDWELSHAQVEQNLDSNTGVLPVIPFGNDVNISEWVQYGNLIIDAAASLGATIQGLEKLNSESSIVFSVHATKVFPAGEGGIAVCGSEELAQKLTSWASFGMDTSRISQIKGTNAKMTEVVAAYGLAALINHEAEEKEWLARRSQALKIQAKLRLEVNPICSKGVNPYWIVELPSASLNEVIEKLEFRGVSSRRWWPAPLSKMPAFQSYRFQKNINAEHISSSVLGLPFSIDQTPEEFDQIANALSEILT